MGQTLIGLLQKTSSHNRPRQIAWAIVWGCVLGLIPKSSLLFPLALMVSVLLPLHLFAAMVCMLITSCFSALLHPTFGNVGHWMFGSLGLVQVVQRLESYPLVPWMKLHNTAVMGSLFLSFVAFMPCYWLVHQIIASLYANWFKLQLEIRSEDQVQFEPIPENIEIPVRALPKNVATSVKSPQAGLASAESTTTVALNTLRNVEEVPSRPPIVAPDVAPRPLSAALDQFDASMSSLSLTSQTGDNQKVQESLTDIIDSIHALENLLEQAGFDLENPLDPQAVLARATRATELVDDILNSLDAIDSGTTDSADSASITDRHSSIDSDQQVAGTSGISAEKTPKAPTPTTPLRSMRSGVDGVVDGGVNSPTGPTLPAATISSPAAEASKAAPSLAIWIDPNALPKVRVDAAQIYQSHDTKISIYRRARTGETTVSTSDSKPQLEKDSMSTASETTDQQANLAVVVPPQSSNPSTRHSSSGQNAEANAVIRKHDNMRHEEALRHLLDHLRALKEKV